MERVMERGEGDQLEDVYIREIVSQLRAEDPSFLWFADSYTNEDKLCDAAQLYANLTEGFEMSESQVFYRHHGLQKTVFIRQLMETIVAITESLDIDAINQRDERMTNLLFVIAHNHFIIESVEQKSHLEHRLRDILPDNMVSATRYSSLAVGLILCNGFRAGDCSQDVIILLALLLLLQLRLEIRAHNYLNAQARAGQIRDMVLPSIRERALRRVLTAWTALLQGWNEYVHVWSNHGDHYRALVHFETARDLFTNPSIQFTIDVWRANIHYEVREYDEAVRQFTELRDRASTIRWNAWINVDEWIGVWSETADKYIEYVNRACGIYDTNSDDAHLRARITSIPPLNTKETTSHSEHIHTASPSATEILVSGTVASQTLLDEYKRCIEDADAAEDEPQKLYQYFWYQDAEYQRTYRALVHDAWRATPAGNGKALWAFLSNSAERIHLLGVEPDQEVPNPHRYAVNPISQAYSSFIRMSISTQNNYEAEKRMLGLTFPCSLMFGSLTQYIQSRAAGPSVTEAEASGVSPEKSSSTADRPCCVFHAWMRDYATDKELARFLRHELVIQLANSSKHICSQMKIGFMMGTAFERKFLTMVRT